MRPDAVQTRITVEQHVALQTPVDEAASFMTASGYRCTAISAAHYLDHAEAHHPFGPEDILRCDPAPGIAARWQVIFGTVAGHVTHIAVGTVLN